MEGLVYPFKKSGLEGLLPVNPPKIQKSQGLLFWGHNSGMIWHQLWHPSKYYDDYTQTST